MKSILRIVFLSIITMSMSTVFAQPADASPFVSTPEIEGKIDELLSRMTVDEKVGQMNQYTSSWDLTGPPPSEGDNKVKFDQIKSGLVGSMLNVLSAEATREAQEFAVEESRLGIPMIFGYDVVHGYKTMMPVPLGETASWDLELIEKSAAVAAAEASAAGVHWTFAPMVDISRDARWGRVMEGAGEDPYLASLVAAARVKGFQGDDLKATHTIAACAKHFAAYGFAEAGRDYNTVDISLATMKNVVLPPFKACLDAGAASFMNAFNEWEGIPATGDHYLQRELLKGEWDFQGFVVSDWGSIGEMVNHGYAADNKHAAELAVNAGSDMDMESRAYVYNLAKLVKEGKVEEKVLDDAVRRILRVKFQLGLFDDPYKYCDPEREERVIMSDEHMAIAREAAKKSIVLLKNDNAILPLKKEGQKIAVIGPLAKSKDVPLGSWRAQAITNSAISLWEGMESAISQKADLSYAEGAALTTGERSFLMELTFNEDDTSGFSEALEVAKSAEVVVFAIGEDCWQTGEGRSQTNIELAGVQMELFRAIKEVNPNVVVVLMNGRPVAIPEIAENATAILEVWHLGSQAGHGIADVLFGDYNPAGKLPVSFPRATGQVPIAYNHKNTGRPTGGPMVFWSHYTDEENSPLYPFGYGLSYTTFEYGELSLSSDNISLNETLTVTCLLENTGNTAGIEVAQLYIRDKVASITRPVKELKGFERVALDAGESKEVRFDIDAQMLGFYNRKGDWVVEAGEFDVFVGTNSQEVKMGSFQLKD